MKKLSLQATILTAFVSTSGLRETNSALSQLDEAAQRLRLQMAAFGSSGA